METNLRRLPGHASIVRTGSRPPHPPNSGKRLDPGAGPHVAVTTRNRGSHAAPYGTGSHPYLTVRTPSVDECELTLPAARWPWSR